MARDKAALKALMASDRDGETRSRVHEALSIARGHPGKSLSWATRRAGTTIKAVSRHEPSGIEREPNGRYRIRSGDRGVRVMPLISAGVTYPRGAIRGSRQSSLVGKHLAAISEYLETGDETPLRRFAGKAVTGTLEDGVLRRFELEADPDVVAELAFSGELSDLVVES
jgi:hypothetical protein